MSGTERAIGYVDKMRVAAKCVSRGIEHCESKYGVERILSVDPNKINVLDPFNCPLVLFSGLPWPYCARDVPDDQRGLDGRGFCIYSWGGLTEEDASLINDAWRIGVIVFQEEHRV